MDTVNTIKELKDYINIEFEYNLLDHILDNEKIIYFDNTTDIYVIITTYNNEYYGIIIIRSGDCFGELLEWPDFNGDLETILKDMKTYIDDQIVKFNHFIASGKEGKAYLNSGENLQGFIIEGDILNFKLPNIDDLNLY